MFQFVVCLPAAKDEEEEEDEEEGEEPESEERVYLVKNQRSLKVRLFRENELYFYPAAHLFYPVAVLNSKVSLRLH